MSIQAEVIPAAVSSVPKIEKKIPEVKPGKAGVYKIVKAVEGPYKGDLVLDLGFSNYFKFGNMKEFQEGDLVFAEPVKESKKGLATMFNFKRVIPLETREQVHIVTEKNPVYGDASMLYTYKAYVVRVVDGDTLAVIIDLGFGFNTKQKLRLRGLDAPEMDTPAGPLSKDYLEKQLASSGNPVLIKAVRSDKYDRYLADIWIGKRHINQELIDKGFAVRMEE